MSDLGPLKMSDIIRATQADAAKPLMVQVQEPGKPPEVVRWEQAALMVLQSIDRNSNQAVELLQQLVGKETEDGS